MNTGRIRHVQNIATLDIPREREREREERERERWLAELLANENARLYHWPR